MYLTKVLLTVALAQCAFAVGQDEQKSTESPEDNNMCGICQEKDETVVTLICGCFAHSDCMGDYIKANAKKSMLRCFGVKNFLGRSGRMKASEQCPHIITREQIKQYGTEKDVQRKDWEVQHAQDQEIKNAQGDPEVAARRRRGEEHCPDDIFQTDCKCTGKVCDCDGTKQCPGCGNYLSREVGNSCNHFTHSGLGGCKCEFCWTCGGPCERLYGKYTGHYVDYFPSGRGCGSGICNYVGPARPGYCVKRTGKQQAQKKRKRASALEQLLLKAGMFGRRKPKKPSKDHGRRL